MTNKYDALIIDGNNVYARNYFAFVQKVSRLKDGTELITGGIHGFLKSIRNLEKKFLERNGGIMYVVFDNSTSRLKLRKDIDPDYKKNKIKKDPAYYKGLDFLQLILLSFHKRYKLVYRSKYEADDLVKPLITDFIDRYNRVLLVSEDLDWSRMIEHNNRPIYWFAKNTVVDSLKFESIYGYAPTEDNIITYKAFRGDDSDGIPKGVPMIRKKLLIQLIKDFDSVDDILANINHIDYLGSWKERILKNSARLKINRDLVSFLPIGREEMSSFIYDCDYSPRTLSIIYSSLQFSLREVDLRVYNYMEKQKDNDFDDFFEQPRGIPTRRIKVDG